MNYKIKVYYETGDSFGHHDAEDFLGPTWHSLEKAQKALHRIKEHYDWYESRQSRWSSRPDEVALPKPSWHHGPYEMSIFFELDNGNEVQLLAFWCGYFEKLYSAEIVSDDEDMKIEFNRKY